MNERKIAAAIYRLSNPNHAKADLDLLAKLKPEIVKTPDFRTLSFSPRHNHALILKKLLDVTTEQAIEDNRRPQQSPAPTDEETPPPPADEETPPPPTDEETPPPAEDGEKATVPGSSAAGQNKEVPPAGQNKKKSPKKTSTRTSTGKTSSTATSKKQS